MCLKGTYMLSHTALSLVAVANPISVFGFSSIVKMPALASVCLGRKYVNSSSSFVPVATRAAIIMAPLPFIVSPFHGNIEALGYQMLSVTYGQLLGLFAGGLILEMEKIWDQEFGHVPRPQATTGNVVYDLMNMWDVCSIGVRMTMTCFSTHLFLIAFLGNPADFQ